MKFTATATGTKVVNRAGGEAYKQNPKLELVSLLLTSFVKDKFYEKESSQLARLENLVGSIPDKKFVGKAAIYARTEFGMRSVTHALLGNLVKIVKKEPWVKDAIAKAVIRPDDMIEIMSFYLQKFGKPIPNNLKKGLKKAIDKFDGYQLAKYRAEGKALKMVDLFNLIHPKPETDKQIETFEKLMSGKLVSTDTWESKLTQAGQKAENEEQKEQFKKDAWIELISERKLGYFALLRNLRNIMAQAPEILDKAIEMLIDERLIRKSLVLPFRFQTAITEIKQSSTEGARKVLTGLAKAMDISMVNVPVFDGKTLVVLDESGSMNGKPMDIGSIFAAALYKANDADLLMFSERARFALTNPIDSVASIAEAIKNSMRSGGTNFHCIFQVITKPYDRIIILSDMQGWIGYTSPVAEFALYKNRANCNPFVYSFDLNGYGDMQFPEQTVFCIAGFSEKIFDIMALLEKDKNALINKIDSIEL